MQREFKKNLSEIATKRRESQVNVATKREERLRSKITKALALDSDARTLPQRLTDDEFKAFRKHARSNAAVVKEIKLNVSCLKTFYGHKQKDLIAYSVAGRCV